MTGVLFLLATVFTPLVAVIPNEAATPALVLVAFIAYVVIKLVRGKSNEIHGLMWTVAALFVVYFAIDPIRQLLGAA